MQIYSLLPVKCNEIRIWSIQKIKSNSVVIASNYYSTRHAITWCKNDLTFCCHNSTEMMVWKSEEMRRNEIYFTRKCHNTNGVGNWCNFLPQKQVNSLEKRNFILSRKIILPWMSALFCPSAILYCTLN